MKTDMASHFFALFSRMQHMSRWALMRNTREETLSQHSLEVAAIAHTLAVIGNKRLGKNYDASRIALSGIYHDMPEIITGDMPTPVKYYNQKIRESFKEIEDSAASALLDTLPEDLRDEYVPLVSPDETTDEYKLLKAADRISALKKCMEELSAGNSEFSAAEKSTRRALAEMNCREADIFIEEFLGSLSLDLDTLLKE